MALSKWVDPFSTTNVIVAASFPLSAFFFYLLARDLTGSRTTAILGGFLFAFSPWHFAKAEAYTEMATIQWVALYGWCVFRYLRSPRLGTALMAGAAFCILLNFSYVLVTMSALFSAPFLLAGVIRDGRDGRWSTLVGLVSSHLLSASWFIEEWLRIRSERAYPMAAFLREVDVVSLKKGTVGVIHFFLPTYWHPLWGKSTREYYEALKPATWLLDDVVNPGYVAWGLCVLAGMVLIKCHRKDRRNGWILVLGAVFAALLCLNPVHGGVVWPLPNAFFHHLVPAFRFLSRFGLMVSFFICLFACWGFAKWTLSWDGRRRAGLALVLMMLAGFELYRPTRGNLLDARKVPPVYDWLKARADRDAIAEYPLTPKNRQFEPAYLFWQIYHGRPLVNADYPNVEGADFRATVGEFGTAATVEALRKRRIRYMIIHKYNYIADWFPGRNPHEGNVRMTLPSRLPGARLAAEWDDAGVYEIEAASARKGAGR